MMHLHRSKIHQVYRAGKEKGDRREGEMRGGLGGASGGGVWLTNNILATKSKDQDIQTRATSSSMYI